MQANSMSRDMLLKLLGNSATAEEFQLKCAMVGLKAENVISAIANQVAVFWAGQWKTDKMQVTCEEFFAAKKHVREAANMCSLADSMATFVSSYCYCSKFS